MRASRRRPRRPTRERLKSEYLLCVAGPDAVGETAVLEVDNDLHAVRVAFLGCSAFGHSLWRDGRFLGCFEPGEGRLSHLSGPHPPPSLEIN